MLSIARPSARAAFDDALHQYRKQTKRDVYSNAAASAAGLANVDGPADIHATFKSMLADVCRSQDKPSKLDAVLGKVLDVLLLFNEIGGELATAAVRHDTLHTASY